MKNLFDSFVGDIASVLGEDYRLEGHVNGIVIGIGGLRGIEIDPGEPYIVRVDCTVLTISDTGFNEDMIARSGGGRAVATRMAEKISREHPDTVWPNTVRSAVRIEYVGSDDEIEGSARAIPVLVNAWEEQLIRWNSTSRDDIMIFG